MGYNFNINPNISPNFKLNSFENSIQEFNKIFQNSINNVNSNIQGSKSFDEIFNDEEMLSGTVTKTQNISPSAKMASDIKNGFLDGINQLNETQKSAQDAFETFASGGDISVHEVMIQSQKSNLAMQMAIQLRNQMINAYQEFKNLSI